MVGRKITIIASPLLKEWKLKKLMGRDGVIIKKNQNQKTIHLPLTLNDFLQVIKHLFSPLSLLLLYSYIIYISILFLLF